MQGLNHKLLQNPRSIFGDARGGQTGTKFLLCVHFMYFVQKQTMSLYSKNEP